MTFKEYSYECTTCSARVRRLRWNHEPVAPCECGGILIETSIVLAPNRGVVDDTVDGHWCETLGHDNVWVESKSRLAREAAHRGLENVVRHDDHYYQRQRRQHDERLADLKES